MNFAELDQYLLSEIKAFPCNTSLLMKDLDSGQILHTYHPDTRCVSASTIKVPILLSVLDQVMRGQRSLTDLLELGSILPDTEVFERGISKYSLWELLYWMIVESDNTATNCCIDALGYDAINAYTRDILLMQNTICERNMLDWAAIQEGRNNYTSATDQCCMYQCLYEQKILTPALRETALDMLRRQRSMDLFLRYIPESVTLAHKTGGLDYLNHDAGIFYLPNRAFYLGIFTWNGPSMEGDSRQKQLIGRLTKAIYDTYKEARL